ncbi:MAG TPA: fumarate hydratase, partial [Rectinemataceae bacterium]
MDWSEHLDFGPASAYERLPIEACRSEGGRLIVPREGLKRLAFIAFSSMAFAYPAGHLERLAALIDSVEPGSGEALVISSLLVNAAIAAQGVYPLCQDTGTALIYGWKGAGVDSEGASGREAEVGSDAKALAEGAEEAYSSKRLRKSQLGPISALEEKNTGDNLPAMVDISADGGRGFRFLFAAKGGGSSSKFSLSMESPAILDEGRLVRTLESRVAALGPSACPPYTLGVVLGGQSPSQALKILELAVYGLFDSLPASASGDGSFIRCRDWEEKL